MRTMKSAVLSSEDNTVIEQIGQIITAHDYSIIVVNSAIKSILNILEKEVNLLILDLNNSSSSNTDLIKIVKKMRPRLPIVVLSEDFTLVTVRKYTEAGVFYCAMKPIQTGEIENVLEAVLRYYKKNNNNIRSCIKN